MAQSERKCTLHAVLCAVRGGRMISAPTQREYQKMQRRGRFHIAPQETYCREGGFCRKNNVSDNSGRTQFAPTVDGKQETVYGNEQGCHLGRTWRSTVNYILSHSLPICHSEGRGISQSAILWRVGFEILRFAQNDRRGQRTKNKEQRRCAMHAVLAGRFFALLRMTGCEATEWRRKRSLRSARCTLRLNAHFDL